MRQLDMNEATGDNTEKHKKEQKFQKSRTGRNGYPQKFSATGAEDPSPCFGWSYLHDVPNLHIPVRMQYYKSSAKDMI